MQHAQAHDITLIFGQNMYNVCHRNMFPNFERTGFWMMNTKTQKLNISRDKLLAFTKNSDPGLMTVENDMVWSISDILYQTQLWLLNYSVTINSWNWMVAYSVLWLLMPWCWSIRPSIFTVVLITFSQQKSCASFIKFSLKCVPQGPTWNTAVLVQVMAWCRTGAKPLPKPMLTLFTNTCIVVIKTYVIYLTAGGHNSTLMVLNLNFAC